VSDPAVFGRVAVLMGGTSAEREVSLDSGRNVLEALRARDVDAFAVDGIPALIDAIHDGRVDRVFNILHGNKGGGEDGVLQGLLEALGVPYTGSNVLGTALSMDKIRTKQVWLSVGLPTPRYVRLSPSQDGTSADVHAAARELGLPVIIKPSCEGSSVGVSRVHNDSDLDEAVALAARYPGEMLMEQLVVGDELTVGILGSSGAGATGQHVALPSIRIVPKGEWYDYNAKYIAEDTQYLCPGLEGADEVEIRRIALAAFEAAGCTGWGRVDVMRDRDSGAFYLLEVNTAPGMTSHSLVPKAAREVGIGFEELCWRVLESSLAAEVVGGGAP
jgi:D-alanine-D-alanine ligase